MRRRRRALRASRGRASLLDVLEHLAATLAPWIELVGGQSGAPRLERVVALVVEPEDATQLVVGLDEVRAERQRLAKERLGVLVHLSLRIHQTEIEVRVQGGLAVVVQADGLGQVLDGFAEDLFLEADVSEVEDRKSTRLNSSHPSIS